MIQKHRIYTNIGRDQKVNVEILDTYDLMEILSLKFSQKDIYASGNCSEYGVVVGRISANNGFGIPNAKVSIFIPQKDLDVNDPVISKLYPYTSVSDKDENGYRYNLLPSRQQHSGHAPTGTFPDQEDILTREEVLQVFESYYVYTVKTNGAGDFMIWGVPVGSQTIHVDVDLSDIGCFSLRPYDFIKKGMGVDDFERYYQFKSSSDIDGLPQIVTYDQTIEVYPFWGNEELCEIGISRMDFDLSSKGIKIEPISLVLVSSVTDDNSDAVKRNGKIRRNTGYKCNLQTRTGKVECIRYTGNKVYASDGVILYPELENFNISEVIDEDGIMMGVLPMNLDYVYTNEFGEPEITNDPNKGIATSSIARFRFSLDFEARKTAAAMYLAPNIREFNPNTGATPTILGRHNQNEYSEGMLATYQFSDIFEDYLTVTPEYTGLTLDHSSYNTSVKEHKRDLMLGTNNNNTPEDYFYKFIYGKVYTVSSFQGSHFEGTRRDAFLGIKQIRPTADEDCASNANYFPINFGYRNRTKFMLILSQVLLFLQYVVAIIFVKIGELLGKFFYGVASFFYGIGIGRWRPFRKFSQRLTDLAYRIQDRFTQQLPLTIYPDCEECTTSDDAVASDTSYADSYCRIAEIKMHVVVDEPDTGIFFTRYWTDNTPTVDNYRNTITESTFLTGTTETSNFFPGEYAKDPDGPCSGATALDFATLVEMSELIVIEGLGLVPRYVVEVYGWVNITGRTIISEYVANLRSPAQGAEDISIIDTGGNITVVTYYEIFAELTGINVANDPLVNFDSESYVVMRIYDRSLPKEAILTGSTSQQIEEGCERYDKTYNESMRLSYIWTSGSTAYENTYSPLTPNSGIYTQDPRYMESIEPDAIRTSLLSTVIARTGALRMPRQVNFSRIGRAIYDRKTKSGYSEFRDGVFTIIPVIKGKSNNFPALQEWYRRKRVGLFFCGGVVNYSFIDNWLNGVLYFFKFDKRIRWDTESEYDLNQRGSRFPRELVFYNILDKNFYYRSTPYNPISGFTGQYYTPSVFEILHPTTFYDVGVRDEFLYEICYDPSVDAACSVVRDIGPTSYQDAANIIEYAINYRMDITNAKFDVDDFFNGPSPITDMRRIKILDGDITQLISINCEAGIEAFDLDSPHYYMYNGELLDPENPLFTEYFKPNGYYGPTPIDLKLDYNGALIRTCLNNRLGDFSQKVPFFLWDKRGAGFGPYDEYSDKQMWDRRSIASMKLQRLFSISGVTATSTNYLMPDGEEEYLLMPMTIEHNTFFITGSTEDMLERFDVISYDQPDTSVNGALEYVEGNLWLYVPPTSGTTKDPQGGIIYVVVNKTWVVQTDEYINGYRETFIPQTILNYDGEKQVLSSPFLFYFGLRPEKSALDLLIKYFGPKGAFVTPTPIPLTEITPTPPPPASPSPTPSISSTPGLPPSPSRSVTPSRSAPTTPTRITIVNNSSYTITNVVYSMGGPLSPEGSVAMSLPIYPGGASSGTLPYPYSWNIFIYTNTTNPCYMEGTDSASNPLCGNSSIYLGVSMVGDTCVMNGTLTTYMDFYNGTTAC